jgi:factor associated with neutral sphingomyelinase activation
MQEVIQALYPPRPTASRRRVRRSGSSLSDGNSGAAGITSGIASLSVSESYSPAIRPSASATSSSFSTSPKRKGTTSRFSELLLEHGERHLNDWAVCASSSFMNSNGNHRCQSMKQMEGRLRLCSQSVVFEPRQISRGIVRIPFRFMMACPFIGEGGATSSSLGSSNHNNATLGGGLEIGGFAKGTDTKSNTNAVIVRCDRHVIMKANNVIGPYEHIQTPVEFRFAFQHSSPASMISAARTIFDAEKSSKKSVSVSFAPNVAIGKYPNVDGSYNSMPSAAKYSSDTTQSIDRPFDTSNFLHVHERPLTSNLRCSIKTPLLEKKGCAIVTNWGIYFQSSGSAGMSGAIAQVWSIRDMRAVARRYDGLKDWGLEVYFANHEGGNEPKSSYYSVLLIFESTEVREHVISLLISEHDNVAPLPLPCYTDRSFVESAMELWLAGKLDNFEYLLVLNAAAGRTFHDLSRYPVFPWVLSSYGERNDDDFEDDLSITLLDLNDKNNYRDLSQPIGALNEERFEDFRKRYESMVKQQNPQSSQPETQPHHLHDVPFMYGTHYSAPGYVLYFLLRIMPEHMLCLQAGKFDVPDRLFHSINATYNSVLVNPADVKELIPEMFDPDCYDFLINSMGLQLGNLHTGERVNDVLLPSWAKSAKDFLQQNRAALESDYCTRHLPKWIDLIFGVKSRGSRAKDAKNLFHPMSYLGPMELNSMNSDDDKKRAELQASEFGIVPDQLLCREHPSKSNSWESVEGVVMSDRLRDSYRSGGGRMPSNQQPSRALPRVVVDDMVGIKTPAPNLRR